MSSLIITHDLHLMMLEFVVDKLVVPKILNFDPTIIYKTTVMFHIIDDWLSVTRQQKNYKQYNNSNDEEEKFDCGISVVFAISAAELKREISNVNIEVHVQKDASEYFEMQSHCNIGLTHVPIDSLFNGIIKDLRERRDMREHFNYFHPREPISRSMKNTYKINNVDESNNSASITIYTRLNYFGKSIITEIESFPNDKFHVREETCESNLYQCHEVNCTQLKIGCWDSDNSETSPPVKQKHLICTDNMNILQGVKAETQAVLNEIEQRRMTMNVTANIGKGKEFTNDNVTKIAQGTSKKRNKDEKMTMKKNNTHLDVTDVEPHALDESGIKHKEHTPIEKKTSKKIKANKKIMSIKRKKKNSESKDRQVKKSKK